MLDLDVEVVDRYGQIRHSLGLNDEADGVAICDFGCQAGVAADVRVDLGGGVHQDVAILRRRDSGALALRQGVLGVRTPAGIRGTARTDYCRRKQLVHARGAHRAVVTAAQAHVRNRRPLEADLVGVGVEP